MTTSRSIADVLILVVLVSIVGCAQGAGGEQPRGMADGSTSRVDGGSTPAVDSGRAMPSDGGATSCATADDCSDGLACNGVEQCTVGRCAAGTALPCDDGVACTNDGCVEPGTCEHVASDALCAAGETCSATGCVPGVPACSETPCRLTSPQCGCPSGQACYASGATRACAASGSGAEGAACTTDASCGAGLDCVDLSTVAGRPAMQCARYCTSDADCMGVGSLCLGTLDGITDTRVCTRSCDPIAQTGCAPGLACNVFRESAGAMRSLTDCAGPTGRGGAGSFCTSDSQCEPGSACLGNECLFWCDYATEEGCVGPEYCERLSPRVTLGGVEYGVCL